MIISQISTKTTQYTAAYLQSPANHHAVQTEIQHYSGNGRDKDTAQNSPKYAMLSEENRSFFWGWATPLPKPLPAGWGTLSPTARPQPSLRYWICPCVPPRIPAADVAPTPVTDNKASYSVCAFITSCHVPSTAAAVGMHQRCPRRRPEIVILLSCYQYLSVYNTKCKL